MAGAIELREQAQAKFAEAKALVEGIDPSDLDAETEQKFNATMDEAQQLLGQWQSKSKTEGNAAKLGDVMQFFDEVKGGGAPIPWATHQVQAEADSRKSLGDTFIESDAYKALVESGALKSDRASFKSEPVTVGRKATTDILAGEGRAAGLVTPQYVGNAGDLTQRPFTVRDLFGSGTATSDTISYARMNAFESGAAAVAEATSGADGAKPQSSIGWERIESPVETVATWIAATRRTLADAGQVRALIDNQLRIMLELEVEDQLLNGDGTSPNLDGLTNVTGIQTLDVANANGAGLAISNPDGIRRAKRLVRTDGARVPADALVINPEDAEAYDVMKDDVGRYLFADPTSAGEPTPWGLRRVESEAVAAGTALVGAFNVGATVFQREPVTILTADQHADFFIRNLIVVLAEERLGFAVYYPASFVELTFTTW